MKNIQTIFLRFAILTLLLQVPTVTANPFWKKYISAQTGKRICQATTVYGGYITAGTFALSGENFSKKSIIENFFYLNIGLVGGTYFSIKDKKNYFKNINSFPLLAGSAVFAGSLAGWHYFNKQVEAEKQSSSITSSSNQ